MWLASSKAELLSERRRHIAGPTGCGICGIDSIAEAIRPAAVVAKGRSFSPREIMAAMASIAPLQHDQHRDPRGACGRVLDPARGIVRCARMSAATTRSTSSPARWRRTRFLTSEGMVLLTSRVSVEMVQKTAAIGAPLMVAVSAPTALAVRMADAAGITLAAIARSDGFEVFTHPDDRANAFSRSGHRFA